MHKILIAGGTGFLGQHISSYLRKEGNLISILSRKSGGPDTYIWDVKKGHVDERAFAGVDTIINLAGAGLADHRWTDSYKKEIIDSRVDSARLIFDTLKRIPNHSVKTYISASAVGYYGECGDAWVDEMFRAKEDFLGSVCSAWEKAAHEFESLAIRTVILRIGFVLANDGGALPVMSRPIRLFAGSPLGTSKQYLSWIHVDDLARIFSFAVTQEKLHGTFNSVSTKPVTNKELLKEIANVLHRPLWPVNVPPFVLKMLLGEQAAIVLEGQRVSNEKLRLAGFELKHIDLHAAIKSLIGN
jgi:uncharacterized protein (TIGR01777 family)